jgi:hypothetical protein
MGVADIAAACDCRTNVPLWKAFDGRLVEVAQYFVDEVAAAN